MPTIRATWFLLPVVVSVAGALASPAAAQTRPVVPNLLVEVAGDLLNDPVTQRVDENRRRPGPKVQTQSTLTGFGSRADLKKRGLLVEKLTFSTTATALCVRAGVGHAKDRLALTTPPSPASSAALAVRVHQSMINHIGSTYAGKTVDGAGLEKEAFGRFGSSGAKKPNQKPWSITFAARDPFTVEFADHGFTAVLRLKEFTSGDSAYAGMNVTARYCFQSTPRGMAAVRQGKLAVFPAGFDPNNGKKLGARKQTVRTMLEKRFGRIFAEEIVFKDFQFQGDLGKAGPLSVFQADTRQGWLVMAWRRAKMTE